MPLSMYQVTAPLFQRMLGNLKAILQKGEAYAAAKQIDPATLLGARLHPDMFPLTRQVQIAVDAAKLACSRLSGQDAPKYEDNETTFADLYTRIDNTVAYLASVSAGSIDGQEERDIKIPTRSSVVEMKGQPYLLHWALPNFFFHVTTAYAILRHSGVDVGKMDYLGSF